jgi:hypothetical protein
LSFWDDFVDTRLNWHVSVFFSDFDLVLDTFIRNSVFSVFSVVCGISGHATVVNRVSHPLGRWSGDGSFRRIFYILAPAEFRVMIFRVGIDLSVVIGVVSIGVRSSGAVTW